MATEEEVIDSPICMHGVSIGDESLMQTYCTRLYTLIQVPGLRQQLSLNAAEEIIRLKSTRGNLKC